MELAAPFVQVWLTLGLGIDTAGYAPARFDLGFDVVAPGVPLRAGLFTSVANDDDAGGRDRMRIGAGGLVRWYAHRWIFAGAAVEIGSQERDGSDRMFASLDAIAGVPITPDARFAVELVAGLQGEAELHILGGEPERGSSAHATARLVLRL